MVNDRREYVISGFQRQEFISMLNETKLFVFKNNNNGQHIYVANPKENHKRLEGKCLPIAFMGTYCTFRFVNQDEPSLRKYHNKIKEIYKKAIGNGI